jgi:predicted transcriptional regulator
MSDQLLIRIDADLKKRFNRLAKSEGKTTSLMVRELISDYVKDRDIGAYIDGLWDRIGKKLAARGVRPAGVKRAIAETRTKRR